MRGDGAAPQHRTAAVSAALHRSVCPNPQQRPPLVYRRREILPRCGSDCRARPGDGSSRVTSPTDGTGTRPSSPARRCGRRARRGGVRSHHRAIHSDARRETGRDAALRRRSARRCGADRSRRVRVSYVSDDEVTTDAADAHHRYTPARTQRDFRERFREREAHDGAPTPRPSCEVCRGDGCGSAAPTCGGRSSSGRSDVERSITKSRGPR